MQQNAQRHRNTLFVETAVILEVHHFAGEQVIMRLRAPKCAAAARPGSFVHIRCDETLPMRRPLSIMRAEVDSIEVLYKAGGGGLHLLAEKRIGDAVSVLGPIGQPFDADPTRPNCLLIGGGVGIPPMIFLADVLRQDPSWNLLAILGSELPFPFDLQPSAMAAPWAGGEVVSSMPLLEDWGVTSRLCSLGDFDGCFRGYVTELAERWLERLDREALQQTQLFACGPTAMLRAVAEVAGRYDLPCQVSLEEFMACAVGGCAGCTVSITTPDGPAMKRVCVDGPVFEASVVNW